jgi:hypothetical protein
MYVHAMQSGGVTADSCITVSCARFQIQSWMSGASESGLMVDGRTSLRTVDRVAGLSLICCKQHALSKADVCAKAMLNTCISLRQCMLGEHF